MPSPHKIIRHRDDRYADKHDDGPVKARLINRSSVRPKAPEERGDGVKEAA